MSSQAVDEYLERIVTVELDEGHTSRAGRLPLFPQERVETTDDVVGDVGHRS